MRLSAEQVSAPNRQDRQAHVGIHPQRQPGKVWAGVVLPVGKMTVEQMRGLARIARELGDGDIRLTVWQNLLISGIAEENAALVETCLAEIGLTSKATSIRAGLIACTGNTGCKFAASNTKGTAMAIADWVEPRVALDSPINIHLTGCPHSCAQHYIGDIGMIACRVPVDASGEDTVEGFHVLRRRRLRPRRRHRPRALSRRQGRGLPAARRAHAQGLSAVTARATRPS